MAEKYNTTDLQQLIEIKTKEAENAQNAGAPKDAVDKMWAEVEQLKQQQQERLAKENIDNPPKKPEEKRAQGALESVKSAEKASAGIVPPPKEEPNTEGKTFGVVDQKKYESKVAEEEGKEEEKAALKERQEQITSVNDGSTNSGKFDIGEKTEITTPEDDNGSGGNGNGSNGGVTTTTTPETTTTEEGNGGGNGNGGQTTPPQKNDGRYKSSMYGILDAMRNGDIDKSTGLYFMLDALSKAARNTGIDIGNIGAQFSGGTVRNDYQDSLWNQRRGKMFENEVTSELNTAEGTDKEMAYNLAKEDLIGKGLSNEQADLALEASRQLKADADSYKAKALDFEKKGDTKNAALYNTLAKLYATVSSAATKEVNEEELMAIAGAGVLETPEGQAAIKALSDTFNGLVEVGGKILGGFDSLVDFFSDPFGWLKEKKEKKKKEEKEEKEKNKKEEKEEKAKNKKEKKEKKKKT